MKLSEALRGICSQIEDLALVIEQADGIDEEAKSQAGDTRRAVQELSRRIDQGIEIDGGDDF